MAKVDARKCDGDCGRIMLAEDVVQKRVTYRGDGMNGSYTQDLCHDCAGNDVPDGVTLTPRKGPSAGDEDPPTT